MDTLPAIALICTGTAAAWCIWHALTVRDRLRHAEARLDDLECRPPPVPVGDWLAGQGVPIEDLRSVVRHHRRRRGPDGRYLPDGEPVPPPRLEPVEAPPTERGGA